MRLTLMFKMFVTICFILTGFSLYHQTEFREESVKIFPNIRYDNNIWRLLSDETQNPFNACSTREAKVFNKTCIEARECTQGCKKCALTYNGPDCVYSNCCTGVTSDPSES
jgi:hypothetical protein